MLNGCPDQALKLRLPDVIEEAKRVTNVYTEPDLRGRGIGSELLERTIDWARDQGFEFLVLWPAEESVPFYERAGFRASPDAFGLHFDGFDALRRGAPEAA